MPLSNETLKVLENVKQSGKPAAFVLVTKGVKVLSLVVYRKGAADARVREAKENGAGDVACGVVDGKGANLSFKLKQTDGFDKAPVSTKTFRDFLDDETDLGLKATIDIVATLPEVEFESDGPSGSVRPLASSSSPPTTPREPEKLELRSEESWHGIVQAYRGLTDPAKREELLAAASRALRAELEWVKETLAGAPDSPIALARREFLTGIAASFKQIRESDASGNAPDSTGGPQNVAPQRPTTNAPSTKPPAPNTSAPGPNPQPPVTPPTNPQGNQPPVLSPIQTLLQQTRRDREVFMTDVKRRMEVAGRKKIFYAKKSEIDQILTDCETDATSDFGQVTQHLKLGIYGNTGKELAATTGKRLDDAMQHLLALKTSALAYVKDHKDPLVGSLPSRVQKRKAYCQRFAQESDDFIKHIHEKNSATFEICKNYQRLLTAGNVIPPHVVDELRPLASDPLLTDENRIELNKLIKDILTTSKQKGYQLYAQAGQMTEREKIELMEAYGCGTSPTGGTSDVKLLRETDGRIIYALKSAARESEQALDSLGLPNGACAIREDVASATLDKFRELTGIDVGFPKSVVTKVNGQIYAVIKGIPGKMADDDGPKELSANLTSLQQKRKAFVDRGLPQDLIQEIDDQIAATQQRLADENQDLEDVPDRVSVASMSNVLAATMITGQWDCKWGNLIVEGDTARPIDAGAAFSTLKNIDDFLSPDKQTMYRVPALEQLLTYPGGHSKRYTDLPIANQPMDPAVVKALLAVKPLELVAAAKARRDQVLANNPELTANGPIFEDISLLVMKESIDGAQSILKSKVGITLKEFVVAWTAWFTQWAPAFYQRHAPQDSPRNT